MDQDRREFLYGSALAIAGTALCRAAPAFAQRSTGRELVTMTIVELSRLLASGKVTSRQLVEQSLAAIKEPQGEGARTFLSVHEKEALAAAARVDTQHRAGAQLHALGSIPTSSKDCFI